MNADELRALTAEQFAWIQAYCKALWITWADFDAEQYMKERDYKGMFGDMPLDEAVARYDSMLTDNTATDT